MIRMTWPQIIEEYKGNWSVSELKQNIMHMVNDPGASRKKEDIDEVIRRIFEVIYKYPDDPEVVYKIEAIERDIWPPE
jgi:hypothetical protein